MSTKKIVRLIQALYYEQKNTYFPVDTETMTRAIDAVIAAGKQIDTSPEAQLNRLFGHDENMRKLNEEMRKLVNLSRALTDYSADVHDALLYVDGHIVE